MEDYEKANAREWDLHYKDTTWAEASSSNWQVVSGPKKPLQATQTPLQQKQSTSPQKHAGSKAPVRPKENVSPQKKLNTEHARKPTKPQRQAPKMLSDADNEAQQLWRSHHPAKATISIPEELAIQDDGYQTIARENGAFITGQYAQGIGGNKTFSIWGADEAVASTRRAIEGWVREWRTSITGGKTARSARYAKVVSLTPNLQERAEKAWKREVKKQRFRQYPPPGMAFGAIGSFHWPVLEYRPEEVLGMSYEALDPIRMDCSCYVVYRPERSLFQILGSGKDVQEGLLRIRKTCFQIAARQIQPARLYLLHWPDAISVPSHVCLEPYHYPTATMDGLPGDGKTGNLPRGHGEQDDASRPEKQTGLNEERIRTVLLRTLPKLHYYRGNIQMRVRLGRFLAKQFKMPKDGRYTLDEYESMTRESAFTGHVTQELGDQEIEQHALVTLQGADRLLTPQDAITYDLADIKPVYSAVFIFAEEAGDLRLTVTWEETQDAGSSTATFELVSRKWARLERDTVSLSPIVDVCLKDLMSGFAWQFDIQAAQAVNESRLSEKLLDFSQSIKINAVEARKASPDKLFVIHKAFVGHLKSIQQRISYRYGIFGSDYTLELTRFQGRTFQPRRSLIEPPKEVAVYEPRWSLDVYRLEWDKEFTNNERLAIGESADWRHDVDTWFPEDITSDSRSEDAGGAGFAQLMEKLRRVGKLMKDSREDDLMYGMAVG
ncbi:hypothetical protein LTR37_003803 [Vermiconidia calcicola]|uniref:Uncharacterized protein n=1 Tax=Vermiconidia calcicola TaxID=1690605 RepID=A0ACC3NNX7_9PEZI|nr:hypothetical protein LTR37_003803 [Vermiconidia calcicola]